MEHKFFEGVYFSRGVKYGSRTNYKISIPEKTLPDGTYAVVFEHDGWQDGAFAALSALMDSGEAPPCVCVGAIPGRLPSQLPYGFERALRHDNYDIYDRGYADFVVDEFLPYLEAEYGIKFSSDVNMHLAEGGSSGGISAFNLAWFRNDYFRRAYLSSPSFLGMAKGREYPEIIRKYETKPIRIWAEYSETEVSEYFGDSHYTANEGIRALEFAGYDMEWRYYPGEGHCARHAHTPTLIEVYRFLWKDWQTTPITAPRNSHRVESVFGSDTWREIPEYTFPDPLRTHSEELCGDYVGEGCVLYFEKDGEKRAVAEFASEISSVSISCDGCRLYVGGKHFPCLYALCILPSGDVAGRYIHGIFHTYADFKYTGASDFCVDDNDRIFAVTEIGMQTVRPFGLIDVISPMPNDATPERIAFESDEGVQRIIVSAGGKIWTRNVYKNPPEYISHLEPFPNGYFD